MKAFRSTFVGLALVVAAAGGAIVWKTTSGTSSGDRGASRQRNAALVTTTIDTNWGNAGFSLITQPSGIVVADTASMPNGVIYSVGTIQTPSGPRAVVLKTGDGTSYTVKYAINPANEVLSRVGAFNQSTGQKISVDRNGNVWVVFTATTITNPAKYWAVTQLTPNLDYWGTPATSTCSSVCGTVYAPSLSIHDIQVNYMGDKVLIATSEGMHLFNVTAGRPLPLGTVTLTNGSRASNCETIPTVLADDSSDDGFLAAARGSAKNNVVKVNYDGSIPGCDMAPFMTEVSGIDSQYGTVVVYGRSGDQLSISTLDADTGYVFLDTLQMVDVSGVTNGDSFVTGQAVATYNDHMYGTFTVQGSSPATYIIDYDTYTRKSRIFTSLGNDTTGATSNNQAPLLTHTLDSATLISSYMDKSNVATALAVRFGLPRYGLLTAPTFPSTEQNLSVVYGQETGIVFARATNAQSYSITSGSLPNGVTLTSAGDLRGTPQEVGTYTAQITARNDAGSARTTLYINSASKAPGAPSILGITYGYPVSVLGYVEGTRGSDRDVVSAHFKGADGKTVNQQCLNGACVIMSKDLQENTDVTVNLTQSNDSGTTSAFNSIVVRRKVLPEPVTKVVAKGSSLKAVAAYSPSADMHGLEALTYVATVSRASDKSVVKRFAGCGPTSCEMEGLPAGSGYVVTIAILTEDGDVMSSASPEFSVGDAVPEKTAPSLNTEDITIPAHQDFVLPLVATGTGEVTFNVNEDNLPEGVSFDVETGSLVGSVNAGTYEIEYSATDDRGTAEGTVTIIATPGKLRAPGIVPAYNTYDRKFSVFPYFANQQDIWATVHFKWTSTVTVDGTDSSKSGTCIVFGKCTIPNAVWGKDLTLTIQALPFEESGDTPSDVVTFVVHVPEIPPAVPTGKVEWQRMPDSNPDTAVLMGNVRMKPSMKFALTLGASATIQLDATTSCDLIDSQTVLRLDGPRGGCSVDPYVRLLAGDEVLAVDDDGGSVDISAGFDDDGNEIFDEYNLLSSRLSLRVDEGDYTVEATSFSDLFKDDYSRADEPGGEYDLWVTILTTPAEADRLMKQDLVGKSYKETLTDTVTVAPDPTVEVEVPSSLPPAVSSPLPAPTQGPATAASAASVISIAVEPGANELTVAPNSLGTGSSSVSVTANPGGKSCTSDAGQTCTISGLSPWITYTLSASAGGKVQATATGTPLFKLKAGGKAKVSSLGLSAAAKQLKLTLKKGGVRVSGNCSLNAARTSISVGKSGTCTISALTLKSPKPTSARGPTLVVQAVIQ